MCSLEAGGPGVRRRRDGNPRRLDGLPRPTAGSTYACRCERSHWSIVSLPHVLLKSCTPRRHKSAPPARAVQRRDAPCRKIRHPAQSLISFWRPNFRQQPMARGNIRDVGEDSRHLRDSTVRRGHKCRDQTERIDGEIARIGLPAPLDAHGLIGKTTSIPARCAVPGRTIREDRTTSWFRPRSVLSCQGERNRCCSGIRWAYGISPR